MALLLRLLVTGWLLLAFSGTSVQACTDPNKLLTCANTLNDAIKGWTATQYADYTLVCKVVKDYKTCLTDACGAGNLPKELQYYIDLLTKKSNINCDAGCLVSSLFLTLLLFLAARVFTEK